MSPPRIRPLLTGAERTLLVDRYFDPDNGGTVQVKTPTTSTTASLQVALAGGSAVG